MPQVYPQMHPMVAGGDLPPSLTSDPPAEAGEVGASLAGTADCCFLTGDAVASMAFGGVGFFETGDVDALSFGDALPCSSLEPEGRRLSDGLSLSCLLPTTALNLEPSFGDGSCRAPPRYQGGSSDSGALAALVGDVVAGAARGDTNTLVGTIPRVGESPVPAPLVAGIVFERSSGESGFSPCFSSAGSDADLGDPSLFSLPRAAATSLSKRRICSISTSACAPRVVRPLPSSAESCSSRMVFNTMFLLEGLKLFCSNMPLPLLPVTSLFFLGVVRSTSWRLALRS